MDIIMPEMDGADTVEWLTRNLPLIKILVVSMIEKEESILRMLNPVVKGFISKDGEPKELGEAFKTIIKAGFCITIS